MLLNPPHKKTLVPSDRMSQLRDTISGKPKKGPFDTIPPKAAPPAAPPAAPSNASAFANPAGVAGKTNALPAIQQAPAAIPPPEPAHNNVNHTGTNAFGVDYNLTTPGHGGPIAVDDPRAAPHVAPGVGPEDVNHERPPKTKEEMREAFMRDLLKNAGGRDTSEDEALMRELEGDRLGTSLVDQRASMGRGGFASSGAMAAIEGDLRRKSSQGLAGDIMGVRNDARQEGIDNAFKGLSAESELRDQALNDFITRELLGMMNGDEEGGEGGGPGIGDPGSDGSGGGLDGGLPSFLNPGSNFGIDDGTSIFGKGTDGTPLASAPDDGPPDDGKEYYFDKATGTWKPMAIPGAVSRGGA